MKNKKIAIFDIDGTIFRSSLLIEIVQALILEGLFPKNTATAYAKAYQRWVDRKGSYEDYINAVVGVYQKHIKGVSKKQFQKVARQMIDAHKNKVYRYTRDLILELKKKDYILLAISHSPKELADIFCRKWGFDKVYGRIYEVDASGNFTGKVLHLDLINDKAEILKRATETLGVSIKGSVGVGDSEGDISMLSMVQKPICFNPNAKLYAHAKKKKWKVVIERKDVIYNL